MSYLDEYEIKEAVRNGDGRLLAQTVWNMPFPSFGEIKAVILSVPGGSRYVASNRIVMGKVWILNHFGSPLVVYNR